MKILNDFDLLDVPYMIDIVFFNELQKQELITSINKEGIKCCLGHPLNQGDDVSDFKIRVAITRHNTWLFVQKEITSHCVYDRVNFPIIMMDGMHVIHFELECAFNRAMGEFREKVFNEKCSMLEVVNLTEAISVLKAALLLISKYKTQ